MLFLFEMYDGRKFSGLNLDKGPLPQFPDPFSVQLTELQLLIPEFTFIQFDIVSTELTPDSDTIGENPGSRSQS
jgi:hypothetical protein